MKRKRQRIGRETNQRTKKINIKKTPTPIFFLLLMLCNSPSRTHSHNFKGGTVCIKEKLKKKKEYLLGYNDDLYSIYI